MDRRNFIGAAIISLAGCGGPKASPEPGTTTEAAVGVAQDQVLRNMHSVGATLLVRPDGMTVLRVQTAGEYVVENLYEGTTVKGVRDWRFTVKEASPDKSFDCELPGANTDFGHLIQVIRHANGEGIKVERFGRQQRNGRYAAP